MTQWLNKFSLPQPLAEAIMEDLYHAKRDEGFKAYCRQHGLPETTAHYSVNELIKPPQMVVLTRRYAAVLVKDVASEIYRILGQAVHQMMFASAERANARGEAYYEAEQRVFYHFTVAGQTVVVSGEPDLVHDGVIDDYKVTAVWSWLKGVKDEWEKQLNLYGLFRTMAGKLTRGLRICFILRDWNLNETVQEDYPPAGAQVAEVTMWPYERQVSYLKERLELHLRYRDALDDELPECSGLEMWEKEEAWAVIREGGQRAWRVCVPSKATPKPRAQTDAPIEVTGVEFETPAEAAFREANELMVRGNTPQKGKKPGKPYVLEHRPGERTRCLRFCDARQFCPQLKEYQAAAFRGDGHIMAEEIA